LGRKNGFLPPKTSGGYSLSTPIVIFTFRAPESDFQGGKIDFPGYSLVRAAEKGFWGGKKVFKNGVFGPGQNKKTGREKLTG
jgi:hypothetical protein